MKVVRVMVLACVLPAACVWEPSLSKLPRDATQWKTEWKPPTLLGDEAHRNDLQALYDETRAVVASREFGWRLGEEREISTRMAGDIWHGKNLLATLRGLVPDPALRPSFLGVGPQAPNADANTRLEPARACAQRATGANAPSPSDELVGCVVLGEETLARWRCTDPVPRSCAIGTLAHELTHTISTKGAPNEAVFTDTGFDVLATGERLGSFTVGAIAQCTYLESQNIVSDDEFDACLDAFGTGRIVAVPAWKGTSCTCKPSDPPN